MRVEITCRVSPEIGRREIPPLGREPIDAGIAESPCDLLAPRERTVVLAAFRGGPQIEPAVTAATCCSPAFEAACAVAA